MATARRCRAGRRRRGRRRCRCSASATMGRSDWRIAVPAKPFGRNRLVELEDGRLAVHRDRVRLLAARQVEPEVADGHVGRAAVRHQHAEPRVPAGGRRHRAVVLVQHRQQHARRAVLRLEAAVVREGLAEPRAAVDDDADRLRGGELRRADEVVRQRVAGREAVGEVVAVLEAQPRAVDGDRVLLRDERVAVVQVEPLEAQRHLRRLLRVLVLDLEARAEAVQRPDLAGRRAAAAPSCSGRSRRARGTTRRGCRASSTSRRWRVSFWSRGLDALVVLRRSRCARCR